MTPKKHPENHWKDRAAHRLAAWVLKVQCGIASRLQNQERRLSTRQKKKGLILFCVAGGTGCLMILYQALHPGPPVQVTEPAFRTPVMIRNPEKPDTTVTKLILKTLKPDNYGNTTP